MVHELSVVETCINYRYAPQKFHAHSLNGRFSDRLGLNQGFGGMILRQIHD